MQYRWKLLILFVIISILPILVMRTVGVRVLRNIGHTFVKQSRQYLSQDVETRVKILLDNYSLVLWAGREKIETALAFQAAEASRWLNAPPTTIGRVHFREDFRKPATHGIQLETAWIQRDGVSGQPEKQMRVSYGDPVFYLPDNQASGSFMAGALGFSGMTETYQKIQRLLAKNQILWQHTALENGLCVTYPGQSLILPGFDPRKMEWFQKAQETGRLTWTSPHSDPISGEMVLTVSMPIKGTNGEWAGVAAIELVADAFFNKAMLSENLPHSTLALLVRLVPREKNTGTGVAIIASNAMKRAGDQAWRYSETPRWLSSEDKEQWQVVLQDLERGADGMRRMRFDGKDSLWAYAPIHTACFLVFILPYDEVLRPAQVAEAYVTDLTADLLMITRIGLGILVLVLVILASAFSRTVTRPIKILERAAQRLAHGDFSARVNFHSKDEFGRMGQVFNLVGPRLQEHYHMQRSLNLAMEVQQNLLPKNPPVVPGLDIAGASIYCDETGGDYYDFLSADHDGTGKVAVVVGDVTGHGVSSALLMTTARAFIRQRYPMAGPLHQIVADVNRQLADDVEDSGRFMTFFLLEVDRKQARMDWVAAGHDAAILYDLNQDAFEMLAGKGLPLGVDRMAVYATSGRSIASGEIIVIGTDGIWETCDPSGDMFGKAAMREVIRRNARHPAAGIAKAVIDAVEAFRADGAREDDVTLVVIKVEDGLSPEQEK